MICGHYTEAHGFPHPRQLPEEPSRTYSDLLDRLSASPRPAAVWYDGHSGERVELSGRVLANWAVKLINLLSTEWEITPQTHLIVDMPPHWKAAAVHVAARALGPAAVRCDAAADPEQLVVTSDPQSWIAGGTEFDELAGVSLGLLDSSFEEVGGEPLPAWALDISAEVRQHPISWCSLWSRSSAPVRQDRPRRC
ncbi:TIGR03089 family protein [Nesterenkonia pannonica]|uniref:TIGR03089 family protein n=1 Tax=Nesterenkonia pannonica TaxID=1548602 RepID=UPI00216495CC|nr:TIGR03089 family protein [Nesterenkonia pannonica]